MKIYADEFIQALEVIEGILEKRVATLANELNRDSMIECRNISIGDSNEFGNEFFVNPTRHKLDVSNELHSRNKSVEEIGDTIALKLKKCIYSLIEETINESETPITRARHVRKFIKVVIDQDAFIDYHSQNLCFKVGIEEYKGN
jgi:hypothetical protein